MNEKTPSPFTHLFNYGAICGLVMFVIALLLWMLGIFPLGTASVYFFWVPLVFMYVATKTLRNNYFNGTIHYWGAFKAQMLVVSSYALLYVLLIYIFGKLIYTDLANDYIQTYLRELDQSKEGLQQVLGKKYSDYEDQIIEDISKTTLSSIALKEYFNKILSGAFFALILSFKLKRINPIAHVESKS
ncbi:MAG: DUF4199 domain-containing protein [Bacteroidota bacterium]